MPYQLIYTRPGAAPVKLDEPPVPTKQYLAWPVLSLISESCAVSEETDKMIRKFLRRTCGAEWTHPCSGITFRIERVERT